MGPSLPEASGCDGVGLLGEMEAREDSYQCLCVGKMEGLLASLLTCTMKVFLELSIEEEESGRRREKRQSTRRRAAMRERERGGGGGGGGGVAMGCRCFDSGSERRKV